MGKVNVGTENIGESTDDINTSLSRNIVYMFTHHDRLLLH